MYRAEESSTSTLFFCVLDGHGEFGELVSGFFQRELARNFFAHKDFVHNPRQAFVQTLQRLENRLLKDSSIDTHFSGTTLVAALLRGQMMLVFNVGDSRISIAKGRQGAQGEVQAVPITVDHKPDVMEEKARIIAAGGRVFAVQYDDGVDGPARVWLGHLDVPGLAMSRSLGDAVAHTVGVSSEPEIHEWRVEPDQELFMVRATGGLWEFVSNQKAIDLAAKQPGPQIPHRPVVATDGLWEFISNQEAIDLAAKQPDPQQAVDALIQEASRRWLQTEDVIDDTTVCVAFFGKWAGIRAG